MIVKVKHDDGHIEVIPCDHTVELLAMELGNMGLSYPISENDVGLILDYFTDMDAEIGQVERDYRATRKYDEQVCRAVDEFNYEGNNEYVDFKELNRRLKAVLDRMEDGSFVPWVKVRWRKRKKEE